MNEPLTLKNLPSFRLFILFEVKYAFPNGIDSPLVVQKLSYDARATMEGLEAYPEVELRPFKHE